MDAQTFKSKYKRNLRLNLKGEQGLFWRTERALLGRRSYSEDLIAQDPKKNLLKSKEQSVTNLIKESEIQLVRGTPDDELLMGQMGRGWGHCKQMLCECGSSFKSWKTLTSNSNNWRLSVRWGLSNWQRKKRQNKYGGKESMCVWYRCDLLGPAFVCVLIGGNGHVH